jgi:hypothetical protein
MYIAISLSAGWDVVIILSRLENLNISVGPTYLALLYIFSIRPRILFKLNIKWRVDLTLERIELRLFLSDIFLASIRSTFIC